MEENKNEVLDDKEITLRELILKLNEFYQEVKKSWKLVSLVSIFFMVYFLYDAFNTPANYSANLTFMLNEDDQGGAKVGGLAASFGLGGGSGGYNLQKIHALLKTRTIIQKALFEKANINNNHDYFINHLIHEYDFHDNWKKNDALRGFLFQNAEIDSFSRVENRALKSIHNKIINENDGLLNTSIDNDTGIMTIRIISTNEETSIKFSEVLFNILGEYYTSNVIEKQLFNFEMTKQRSDSLKLVLDNLQLRLLRFKDTQRNLILKQSQANELKLQREIQAISGVYTESRKNQEIANFALQSKTPFIQPIDLPIPPLSPDKSLMTYVFSLIQGVVLGLFLSILFIIGRKIIRDAMLDI